MIYYIGYYCRKEDIGIRYGAVSAISKMDYILSVLERQSDNVEVLSRSYLLKKKPKTADQEFLIGTSSKLKYFSDIDGTNRLRRFFARANVNRNLKGFCKNGIEPMDTVVIYHSTDDLPIIKYLKDNIKCKVVLEIEEIYSDVHDKGNLREKEEEAIKLADGYIVAVESMKKILPEGRPYVVVNGTYTAEKERNVSFSDEKVHCIYAGTFDPTKGGAAAAAAAAAFLPEKYHVHILGFGTEEQKQNLINQIEKVKKNTKCTLTYDGLKTGEEYIQFLQKCHIGLCTQIPDAQYTKTSFPSKILVYLANGLRVLSVRIPAVEQSSVGKILFYYDEQTPEMIANAIQSVDINSFYDSREVLSKIDKKIENEMQKMLRNIGSRYDETNNQCNYSSL